MPEWPKLHRELVLIIASPKLLQNVLTSIEISVLCNFCPDQDFYYIFKCTYFSPQQLCKSLLYSKDKNLAYISYWHKVWTIRKQLCINKLYSSLGSGHYFTQFVLLFCLHKPHPCLSGIVGKVASTDCPELGHWKKSYCLRSYSC